MSPPFSPERVILAHPCTCLHDVELLCDEGVEAMTEGEEEVHGLDRDGAKEPLGPLHTSSAHLVRSDLR